MERSRDSGIDPKLYPSSLRQFHTLPVILALDVVVKEVTVQRRLDESRDPHNPVLVTGCVCGAPDPVENVQEAVPAQAEYIVGSQCLGLPCTLQEEQLRQDGHSLEINRKRPQKLLGIVQEHNQGTALEREGVMQHHRKNLPAETRV